VPNRRHGRRARKGNKGHKWVELVPPAAIGLTALAKLLEVIAHLFG
jgi:hypothetical protein